MSLSRDKLMALMAFADGELVGGEHAAVEALLAKSEEARRVVAAFDQDAPGRAAATWVASRGASSPSGTGHPADGIADAVMARIARQQPLTGSIEAAREKRVARMRLASVGGALILAAAAGAVLYLSTLGSARDNEIVGENTASGVRPVEVPPALGSKSLAGANPSGSASAAHGAPSQEVAANPTPPVAALVQESDGVSVHSVESPHRVQVIYLPPAVGAAPASSRSGVVVWLGDAASSPPSVSTPHAPPASATPPMPSAAPSVPKGKRDSRK